MHGNGLMLNVRFSTEAAHDLLYGFCIGLPVKKVAAIAQVSPRVARAAYIALRDALSASQFMIWHQMRSASLYDATPIDVHMSVLAEPIAACYFDRFCQRNYALGNRQSRLCRKCPIPAALRADMDEEGRDHARGLAETIVREASGARAFYAMLGMREKPFASLPYLQIMHYRTVTTALDAVRKRSGAIDLKAETPLSPRTLYRRMVDHLEAFKVEVG
ncbi:hypothetical protein O9Z70_11930 [Devosia sp. YIM 151766]|uniref:hypothetical protein n=1 Tax=Devosia sp. YIM 151766 TaxID=3017325 RepID=UPI00255C5986|nr:hypothetical protein [Devosia sp. YIM 151766]WIY52170.1 hypothetical protein O9Z70_11930 [Devosia sp. YIM 151766]